LSNKDTLKLSKKDTVYKCLECNEIEVVKSNDPWIDGRICKHCNGKLSPTRYVIGIDLAIREDISSAN